MTDRRYTDDEMAEIFRRATDSTHQAETHAAARPGMSLAELQEIGAEAGIPAEQVAMAARSLDQPHAIGPATRRMLGLPIAVADDAQLDRTLSDAEWDQLVVMARDTFAARGKLRQDGKFRQWTNGNLQVLLEPGTHGDRLRLRTVNGYARQMILMGGGAMGIAAAVSLTPILTGNAAALANLDGMAILGLIGVAMFARGVYGLRRWGERRAKQFRELIERARGSEIP
ncbi:MAG TPA: hypothetical protein VFN22_10745 [Gemmatimonadales bacterium]|nr:hypothetical protein [Gemmatimonadales bacterium]